MSNVTTKKDNALPAHLQGGKKAKIGNIDSTDLIIPRMKLLQAISPEVETFDSAKAGQFWHTIASEPMGATVRGIPIVIRKSYVLWAPRGDDRGILARADDGLNWDNAGMEFTVKPKNSPHDVTYKLGQTVHDKPEDGGPALSEFGSSIPGNPNSPPAAALTYQMMWFFPDFPDYSPALIINTRSSVKPAKQLISRIDLKPVDHFGQIYIIGVTKEPSDEGYFYNYTYTGDGYADEELYEHGKLLFERFGSADWRANDETAEPDKDDAGGGRRRGGTPADDKDIPF